MRTFPTALFPLLLCLLLLAGCGGQQGTNIPDDTPSPVQSAPAEPSVPAETGPVGSQTPPEDEYYTPDEVVFGDYYTTPEDVAEYLYLYNELPPNFLTKNEAQNLGWDSSRGNLWEVADGMSIGGDRFGNREGLLPAARGRTWYECDVNYTGGYRGGERIVWSSDGLIYYTNDHYQTFTQLYYRRGLWTAMCWTPAG